jgi:signal transduction histidine kinase
MGVKGTAAAPQPSVKGSVFRITFIYVLVSYLWIHFSDKVLLLFFLDAATLSEAQTYKGFAFVTITGSLLFFMLRRDFRKLVVFNQQKQMLIKQLEQKQKNDALGLLSRGITHDFNNLLGSIMGYCELAQDEAQEHPELGSLQEYLNNIQSVSLQARQLTRQVLLFSKSQSDSAEPVDMVQTWKDSKVLLYSNIPSNVTLQETLPTEPCIIQADKSQIVQVLVNLCTNATQAMPAGGVLGVCIEKTPNQVVCKISDTGTGISPIIQDRIFDPYFTTKSAEQGTGLGLSVVYGIVQKFGGSIHFTTHPGVGTTFTVQFAQKGRME